MEKRTIKITNDSMPSLKDYRTNYAGEYGLYPLLTLIIIQDDQNWYESMQRPLFKIVDGSIEEIYWDLGEPVNGFIVFN